MSLSPGLAEAEEKEDLSKGKGKGKGNYQNGTRKAKSGKTSPPPLLPQIPAPHPTPHQSPTVVETLQRNRRQAIWTVLSGWGVDLSLDPKASFPSTQIVADINYPSA